MESMSTWSNCVQSKISHGLPEDDIHNDLTLTTPFSTKNLIIIHYGHTRHASFPNNFFATCIKENRR